MANEPIKSGEEIVILPEWQDKGDDQIRWIAVDDEEKGRVTIEAQLDLPYPPRQVVESYMIRRKSSAS